jgi:hypothetical protein
MAMHGKILSIFSDTKHGENRDFIRFFAKSQLVYKLIRGRNIFRRQHPTTDLISDFLFKLYVLNISFYVLI